MTTVSSDDPRLVTLVEAFQDDPMVNFLMPDARSKENLLPVLMKFMLDLSICAGIACSAGRNHEAVLAAFAPGQYPVPLFTSASLTLRTAITTWRKPDSLRSMRLGFRLQSVLDGRHPVERHFFISAVAVRPCRQGMGLGTAIMRTLFDRADQEKTAVYLETANPGNLGFYEKLGFETVENLRPLKGGPPVWTMLRRPVG